MNVIQKKEKINVFRELSRIFSASCKEPYAEFSELTSLENLVLKYSIAEHTGVLSSSPLHEVDQQLTKERKSESDDEPLKIEYVYRELNVANLSIEIPISTNRFILMVLPRNKNSYLFAQLYFAILRTAFGRLGMTEQQGKKYYLATKQSNKSKNYKVVEVNSTNNSEDDASIFAGFAANVCTDNESEFDLEIELYKMKTVSGTNRMRIRDKMRSMGVKYLRGKKADAYLRPKSTRSAVDLDKLASKYPEAYADCVRKTVGKEYLTIKIHDTEL